MFGSYLLLQELRLRGHGRPAVSLHRFAIVGFLVIVFLKELLWDPAYEVNNPFLWQGVIDLGWYLVGVTVALGLVWLRFRRL